MENKALEYAAWASKKSNLKTPKYVKLQAKAWIKIAEGKDKEAYFDLKEFNKICNLLKLIMHPDLHCTLYEGLEKYAWFFIIAILCTKDRNTHHRYYETALLEIARKNFKTFNAAVIFILLMLIEVNFSRLFSVAPDLKISNELKLNVRKIIKCSPVLLEDDVFKILRSEIRCNLTESEYTPLAYSKDRLDSKVANVFLADEAGAMDEYPIEAMRSSQITLLSRLGIIISTQYPNDDNGLIDEIDISKKSLDGVIKNQRRFSLLYEPDDYLLKNDEWKKNDLVIYQANPVSVENKNVFESIKNIRMMAVLYENKRENFLCKHCNIKYKGLGTEGYIEITKVRECVRKENLEFWKGKDVFVGLDLSMTEDNTSVAMVCIEDDVIYAKVFGFIPGDKKEYKSKKENVDYNRLIRQGVCIECDGEVIDYILVENVIKKLEEKYGVNIVQLGYDKYNALATIQRLEEESIECVEIKQHSSVLHSPTKLLKEKILNKKFAYDENLMLEINFQNARCTEDTNLNKYVNKKKSSGKVDMVVSLINAIYLLEQELLYGRSSFFIQT